MFDCDIPTSEYFDETLFSALIRVESNFNPYAVGIVNGYLNRQPNSLDEAETLVALLETNNVNYSVGISQINKTNFRLFKVKNKFDVCENIKVGYELLEGCFDKFKTKKSALSCYYSGKDGFFDYSNKVIQNESKGVADVNDINRTKDNTPLIVFMNKNQKNTNNNIASVQRSSKLSSRLKGR